MTKLLASQLGDIIGRSSLSSAELKSSITKSSSLLNPVGIGLTGLGALGGAVTAPSENRGEGSLRGMGRVGGALTGAGIGGGTGGLIGSGLGAGLGVLAGVNPRDVTNAALAGGGLGAGLGGLIGGAKGFNQAGDYMGSPSYSNKSKNTATISPVEKKKEKKDDSTTSEKRSFIDTLAQGASLEAARALSQRQSPEKVKERALRGVGSAFTGALGMTGGGALGGGLGALVGATAGHFTGKGLGVDPSNTALAGGLMGAAPGFYYGATQGGRLGYNLFRDPEDMKREAYHDETDMAKGRDERS